MARDQYTKAPKAEPEAPVTESNPVARGAQEPLPAAPVAPLQPKSDRYRVKGPGGVFANGILYQAGSEVQLSEADALSVFDHLELL